MKTLLILVPDFVRQKAVFNEKVMKKLWFMRAEYAF